MRVVDQHGERLAGGHRFDPPGHPRGARQALAHDLGREAHGQGGRRRGERVGDVETSRLGNLQGLAQAQARRFEREG